MAEGLVCDCVVAKIRLANVDFFVCHGRSFGTAFQHQFPWVRHETVSVKHKEITWKGEIENDGYDLIS